MDGNQEFTILSQALALLAVIVHLLAAFVPGASKAPNSHSARE